MRILHTGDWHLGKNLEGQSRIEEQETFLEDFIHLVEENEVDLVLIAGDIYDTSNPPARAEKLFYDTLKRLSKDGERLILIIAGNHDNPERLVAAGPIAMEHGIIMVGTPKSVVPKGNYGCHQVVDSGEGYIEIEIHGEKAVILTVPYPSEKRLNERLYGAMEGEGEQQKTYSERIKSLFQELSVKFREDTINLVISHLFVVGGEETGSERSIQLGGTYTVETDCFPKEAQYVALGHIHKPMIVPKTNKKVRYSGSPIHYNRKEIAFDKGCYLVDLAPKKECSIKEIKFKVYKPIEVWKCESFKQALEKCEENKDRNCWVYLEIKTDQYIREDEIKQLKDFKKDILEIIPIIKSQETFEEMQEMEQKGFEDLFREFYKKEREVEPDEEIINLLLAIVGEEGEEDEAN